jgi:hypothetical protein
VFGRPWSHHRTGAGWGQYVVPACLAKRESGGAPPEARSRLPGMDAMPPMAEMERAYLEKDASRRHLARLAPEPARPPGRRCHLRRPLPARIHGSEACCDACSYFGTLQV